MVPEDVYELTGVSDPRVSPDGATVAYVVWSVDREACEYRSAIWLAPADGSAPPRPFTSGTKRDGSPRWSPGGERLAFTSTREGEHAQLYVMPVAGGEPRRLTDLKEDVSAPAWSPDGTTIAFASRVPDPGLRRGGHEAARAPPLHAAAVQARHRRLDRGPTPAPVHRPRRRRRGAHPDHGRGLRGRRPVLVARRQDRVLVRSRRRLGHEPREGPVRDRLRGRPGEADRDRRGGRAPLVVPGRHADRVPLLPGTLRRPAPHADRRARPGHARTPRPDGVARSQLRALSDRTRADLGRGASALRGRGRRERAPVPGPVGRVVRTGAGGRRRPRPRRLRRRGRSARVTRRRRRRRRPS